MTNTLTTPPQVTMRIRELLAKGVPFTNTPAYADWKRECASLGRGAAMELARVLRGNASEMEKYGAVLALRALGYDAFGQGYGKNLRYVVRDSRGADNHGAEAQHG